MIVYLPFAPKKMLWVVFIYSRQTSTQLAFYYGHDMKTQKFNPGICRLSFLQVKTTSRLDIQRLEMYHSLFSVYCIVKKECRPETCKNGGTCTEIAIGRHLCTCLVGFVGDDCEGG